MRQVLALALFPLLSLAHTMHTTQLTTPTPKVAQLAPHDTHKALWLNTDGKLHTLQSALFPEETFFPEVAPVAKFGRVALLDSERHLVVIENEKIYRSTQTLSPHAPLLALPHATIGLVQQGELFHIARFEVRGEALEMVAVRDDVNALPDAQVLQMDLDNGTDAGHLLLLAAPDATTYQHAVLGDGIEAKALYYLERHSLQDLAQPLMMDKGLVLEANRLQPFDKRFVAVTISGRGKGASMALVGLEKGALAVHAKSETLPQYRWQDPLVFDGVLYTVRMPHLVGELVRYELTQNDEGQSALALHSLGEGYSNHKIRTRDTHLQAITPDFALIPRKGYTTAAARFKDGTEETLTFPSPIVQLLANEQSALVLLDDGSVWEVKQE